MMLDLYLFIELGKRFVLFRERLVLLKIRY
jgi:hypothetical protein